MMGKIKDSLIIDDSCRRVLRQLPIAATLVHHQKIFFANKKFADVMGMQSAAELKGRPLDEIMPPNAVQVLIRMVNHQASCRIGLGKDNNDFYDCFAFNPNEQNQDLVLMALIASKDMRTAHEKGSMQLPYIARAERMQAIERFASEVAHDFNNTLNGVMGYAELLKEHVNSDTGLQFLENILTSAMDASITAGKLLEFASAAKKTSRLFDVNEAVTHVLKIAQGKAASLNIQLKATMHKDHLTVLGDVQAIKQAVLNIITNAIEASDSQDIVEVVTSLHRHVRPNGLHNGDYAVITISDHGHGVPEGIREQIFEPFFSTKAKAKRSGLGLSIVYNTLKEHDGLVEMDSEEGLGSVFSLYLPIHSDVASQQGQAQQKEQENNLVLVVDDDKGVRDLLEKVLDFKGLQSIVAANGYDAVELVRSRGGLIKVVLLDMVMPGMDGRTCYEEIIKLKPNMGVIVMSGYCDETNLHFADAFISKPFSINNLFNTVNAVMNKKRP